MSRQQILVIEDDSTIQNFMQAILKNEDYDVMLAKSGKEGISLAASWQPTLIILDLGLPDMDGRDVLKSIRSWSEVPLLIVSARGNEAEKVACLDQGADDYITKPFGTSELLARIRTALRHQQKLPNNQEKFSVEDLSIDFSKRLVTLKDKAIHLTPNEYKILQLLAQHQGKVLTHDFIMKEVWGPYVNENQALRVNMYNIRRKIEENPADPRYIMTEVGIGYRLVE